MVIFLNFLFFIILLELIFLGLIFSYVTININNIELKKINDDIYFDNWDVSLKIYLYKILPMLKIKIYREYCTILGIKIHYKKKIKYKSDKHFYKNIYNFFKDNNFEKLDLSVEELDLYLNFGTEDMILTTGLTVLISNFITLLIRKKIKKFDKNKYKFKVEPNFININNFRLKLKSTFNLKTTKLISYGKQIYNSSV